MKKLVILAAVVLVAVGVDNNIAKIPHDLWELGQKKRPQDLGITAECSNFAP